MTIRTTPKDYPPGHILHISQERRDAFRIPPMPREIVLTQEQIEFAKEEEDFFEAGKETPHV